jgi:hypothetical protein
MLQGSSGGSQHFTVDPDELVGVARQFDDAADRLEAVLARYTASALPHAEAFGLLPQARAAHGRYLAKVREAQDGLHAVHEVFRRSLAGGLRVNAANYVRADHDSTPA